jgi:putative transposase
VAPGRPYAPTAATRRKLRTGARLLPLADRPNAVWTYDFIHDAAANGLRFKCLTVVDEFTRECLAITVERSLPSRRVLEVLGHLVARYGPPGYLRSDNGPEFIARRVRQWLGQTGITTAYIDPGKGGRTDWARASTAAFATSVWIESGFTPRRRPAS